MFFLLTVPITFEDAPTSQFAVKGQDYKVKCHVRADPEPTVDWKKDHRVVMTNGRKLKAIIKFSFKE